MYTPRFPPFRRAVEQIAAALDRRSLTIDRHEQRVPL
jgi:hypothetical protein